MTVPDVPLPLFSHYPAHPPPVRLRLTDLAEHACSYRPGRLARSRAFMADRVPGAVYHQFMDRGFRRSGRLFYQPTCAGCRACVPLRVPVDTFRENKSQRRCRRRNGDLLVSIGDAAATDEKYALYARYVRGWHGRDPAAEDDDGDGDGNHDDGDAERGRASFERFLYDSPVDTIEFQYRDVGGRLLAVGICDVSPASLSSVYFYFEPDEARRGLGTYGALREIDLARELRVGHYYLGYWVHDCRAMRYKADFRPFELLHGDGTWRLSDAPPTAEGAGRDPADESPPEHERP